MRFKTNGLSRAFAERTEMEQEIVLTEDRSAHRCIVLLYILIGNLDRRNYGYAGVLLDASL